MLAEVRWPAARCCLRDGHGTAVRSWE
jgi:hypothetical protein